MRNRNFQMMRWALLAMAALLMLTETASAQRFRRGRRASSTVERYQWIVPAERYSVPVQTTPTVTVRALLPAPEAELWVDGVKRGSGGATHTVAFSPKNSEGQSQYIVQVLWPQEDRVITDTRTIDAYPGDRITVDFTRPDPKGTNAEIIPKELPAPKR